MPKFKLLYFKTLLDLAFIKFFEEYNQYFQNIDGQYVLTKNLTTKKIFLLFKIYILDILQDNIEQYDIFNPTYYIIIGACIPKDNILLKYKSDKYFPSKLNKIINSDYIIKYLLKEKDIKLDLIKFNTACIDLFNYFFKHKYNKNVIFVQHKELDCYAIFKLINYFYGKCNCVNMYKEKFNDIKSPIIAINDLIDKYINKTKLNKSIEFKNMGLEVKQYIDEKIKNI